MWSSREEEDADASSPAETVADRISDHTPITVDLPLGEPKLAKGKRKQTAQKRN